MYRLPLPDDKLLKAYKAKYKPIIYSAIAEFIKNAPVYKIPMGNSSPPKYYFYCQITPGSNADRWLRGLLDEEKLESLLIGNWDSMVSLKNEIEATEPQFRKSLSMDKYSIKKAYKDVYVEDLNYILNKIFVECLYNKILDKAEVVKMKGIKVCPYCASDQLKNLYDSSGKFKKSQLDHYFPKSKYPFLALNFFNLFPSCKDCNMVDTGKGENSPVSDDFASIYLPYPHNFDSASFNFTCTYDGGDIYDESGYHIDIDYYGNLNLKKGYNDIIPIQPYYQGMTHIPVQIMVSIYEQNQEYINMTSHITGLDKSLFIPSLKSICGFSDSNEDACRNEKHKFRVDIYNSLIPYL